MIEKVIHSIDDRLVATLSKAIPKGLSMHTKDGEIGAFMRASILGGYIEIKNQLGIIKRPARHVAPLDEIIL